jgi:Rieske 2Fe-2S family protein
MNAHEAIPANAPLSNPFATLLPREYYVSEAIYRRELERVFLRQWTFLGHVSEVPEPGDYFRHDLFGESVLVVRMADRGLVAYLNVCRHRGHLVCASERGRAKSFVCPYHQWTYGIDGTLKRAPGFIDGIGMRFSDYGLQKVRIGVWNGFIFGWLGEAPGPSLDDCLDLVDTNMKRLETERLKEIHREHYTVAANWKVLLENYLECYHCHGSHPELCVTMDVEATYRNTDEAWKGQYFSGHLQLRPGMLTGSMTGALVSKPLGEFAVASTLPDGFGAGMGVLPSLSRIIVHIDHALVHVLRPLDVGHVRWETRWYVAGDAVEGRDYDVETVTEIWRRTNLEDIALCENAYRGVCSRRYLPGPLHPRREGAIRPALDSYLELMGRAERPLSSNEAMP